MDAQDRAVVVALFSQSSYGPNDELVNRHDGKAYWVSSMRYSGAGWQTAVFDRKRFLWLSRPIFRVNEMDNMVRALLNHCISLIVVAESATGSWPKGMIWTEPSESSWSEARSKVLSEWPKDWEPERAISQHGLADFMEPEGLVNFYSRLRRRYECVRRVK